MLVDALLEADALTLLVHRLAAFDEKVRWVGGGVGWRGGHAAAG